MVQMVSKERHNEIKRESASRRRSAGNMREKTPEQKQRDAELGRLRYARRKERAAAQGLELYSQDALDRRKHAAWVRSQWRQFKIEFDRYLDQLGVP